MLFLKCEKEARKLGQNLLLKAVVCPEKADFAHEIAIDIVNVMGGADSDIKVVIPLLKSPFLENCLRGRAFVVR